MRRRTSKRQFKRQSKRIKSKRRSRKLKKISKKKIKNIRNIRPRKFGAIPDDIGNLNKRIFNIIDLSATTSKDILEDLKSCGIVENSSKMVGFALAFLPLGTLVNIIKKFKTIKPDEYLNENIKTLLKGIEPALDKNLRIELHTTILNLLLYPETLYAFLPEPTFTSLRNLINDIYTVLIKRDLIGPEIGKFMSTFIVNNSREFKTGAATQKYTDILLNLFPPTIVGRKVDVEDVKRIKASVNSLFGSILSTNEKEIQYTTNELIIPILGDISTKEHLEKYKNELLLLPLLKPLLPLIGTILYNHKNHKEIEKYIKERYY
jgi:hypothetical protein